MSAVARFPAELPAATAPGVLCLDIGLFWRRFGSFSKTVVGATPLPWVCARHDQQLGGASPLWRLMAPTTSRWQLLSREAGWGGSRSAKSRP